jgi:hypothetical protein
MVKRTQPPLWLPYPEKIRELRERDRSLYEELNGDIATGRLLLHRMPEGRFVAADLIPVEFGLLGPEIEELHRDLRVDNDGIHRIDKLAGYQPDLVAATKQRLKAGYQPGKGGNEQWDRFCDEVRKSCGKRATIRGYSDKAVKRIVAELNKQNK